MWKSQNFDRVASFCGLLLFLIVFKVAQAAALERPDTLLSERGFLLPSCPRAVALSAEEAYALPPAEEIWKQAGVSRPELYGTILATLAPAAIDGALNALQEWLEERARARETSLTFLASGFAAAPAPISSAGPAINQCLVLVSGPFGSVRKLSAPPKRDVELDQGEWSQDWLASMGLKGPPRFYAEVNLAYAPHFGAFRIAPIYIEYRSEIGPADSKPRDLTLALVFARNGVAAGVAAVPVARDINPGMWLTPDLLAGQRGPWILMSQPDAQQNGEDSLLQAPFGVQATLVETIEPSNVNQLLARIFGSVKPGIAELGKNTMKAGAKDDGEPKND